MLPTIYLELTQTHIYKQNLALNIPWGLIYHKTQPNQTKPYSGVQINCIKKEYLINRIISVREEYLKLFNCVQTND